MTKQARLAHSNPVVCVSALSHAGWILHHKPSAGIPTFKKADFRRVESGVARLGGRHAVLGLNESVWPWNWRREIRTQKGSERIESRTRRCCPSSRWAQPKSPIFNLPECNMHQSEKECGEESFQYVLRIVKVCKAFGAKHLPHLPPTAQKKIVRLDVQVHDAQPPRCGKAPKPADA